MKLKQMMASALVAVLTAFTATAADLTRVIATATVAEMLSGKVAGVQVTSVSGQPGMSPSIRIRGYGSQNGNAPLIIIDGVEGDLNSINPNDIESLEVLKDASSSAIYGAQGVGGVVLVTTKKGMLAPIILVNGVIYTGRISDIPADDIASITVLKDAASSALYGARAGSGVILVSMKNPQVDASSAPLYVIDGVAGGDFSMLNLNDIESLEVLKDAASAAIYGSAGANGVIIITTKKGKADGVQLWENGPIFATCNLGATKPEEYGWHFWWGDTVGYTNSGSAWASVVDGTTIKFESSDATAKKTCNKSNSSLLSEGWIDGSGNLAAAHDAATAKLGDPWRMMTDAELAALVENCTTVWTNNWNGTGVNGRLVTGNTPGYTDKSIFLPAAGYGHQASFKSANSFGDYWSSTPDSDSQHAWTLYLTSEVFGRYSSGNDRCLGQSVRPVRSAPIQYLDWDGAQMTNAVCTAYECVTESMSAFELGKTYVVNGVVTNTTGITVKGTAANPTRLILCDGAELVVKGSDYDAGMKVVLGNGGTATNAIVICGQAGGTGVIEAIGGYCGAGIGSDEFAPCGHVTVNGGIVKAVGGGEAAGIGGGSGSMGGVVTINGGMVTATGSNGGAGIGGGMLGQGGTVTVNGGEVTATGASTAGIGAGSGYGPYTYDTVTFGTDFTVVTGETAAVTAPIAQEDYEQDHRAKFVYITQKPENRATSLLKSLFGAPSMVEPFYTNGVYAGARVILGENCGPIELPDDLGEVTIVLNGWTISGADGADGDGVTPGEAGIAPITIVPGGQVGLGATALSVVDTIDEDPADYLVIDLTTGRVTHQSVASVLEAEMFTNEIYKTEKLVLRWIPEGSYAVGSGAATDHNLPAFTAVVDKGYYIGLFEFTEAQYSNACGIAGCTSTRPLTEVTWDEFSRFLIQLSKDIDLSDETARRLGAKVNLQGAMAGAHFTLPTELQWEIAARGGSAAEYGAYVNTSGETVAGSAQNIGDFAWYVKNNVPAGAKPVGLKRPNAFGLYDMAGNVWEWCLDAWETPYDTSRTNAEEVCHADVPDRVMRGGTYNDKAEVCRPSYRGCNGADYRDVYNGFRLAVRDAKGPEPVIRPESGEGAALVCGNGGEGNPAGAGCTNGVAIAEGASSAVTVDIGDDVTQIVPGTDGREIAEVKFLQRYPWNGLVDISFSLTLPAKAETNLLVTVYDDGALIDGFVVPAVADASGVFATNVVWDAAAAGLAADFLSDDITVEVEVEHPETVAMRLSWIRPERYGTIRHGSSLPIAGHGALYYHDLGYDDFGIRVRGQRSLSASNDPLIVLDGIPFLGTMSDINPSDIKSMDILKDAASSAIYGSRGSNGVIIITTKQSHGVSYCDWDDVNGRMTNAVCTAFEVVTNETSVLEAGKTYVVWDEAVTNTTLITVEGTAANPTRLILCDGAKLVAEKGIIVNEDSALVICGQPTGAGTLEATGVDSAAGIGGEAWTAGGTVVINGGIVIATGDAGAAGIGGGDCGDGGTVTINGGTVIANGGDEDLDNWCDAGAGIGGGETAAGGKVFINGGTVTAIGGAGTYPGMAIGGGDGCSAGRLTFSDKALFAVRAGEDALSATGRTAAEFAADHEDVYAHIGPASVWRVASSAKGRVDLRPAVTLPQNVTTVSNVTWSSKGWANLVGALDVNIGYTNLTYALTGKLKTFLGSGVTNVALPAYSGDYRLTHSVTKLESFVTFTVDGLTNRTVTVPAALEDFHYVVSNLTTGTKIDAVFGIGGAQYDLPLGDKIAIYCVPSAGYEDRPILGENPYVIEKVTPATDVDSANLPKLGERLVDRIGVCSWTWHGPIADALDAMARDGRYTGMQLALAPWVLGEGEEDPAEAWALVTNKIAAGELNVMSTMINFPYEDYTTLASITNTQGYMYGVATNAVDADEQWASNLFYTAEAARLTAALGVKTLTAEIGFIAIDPELMFERMTNVCEVCKAYGVDFLIESGPQESLHLTNLLARLNAAGYTNVGVNFDPGDNALFGSEDPVAAFEAMRPWIGQVHAKDCRVADEREAWNEDCPWGEGVVSKLDFGGGHTFINHLKAIAYSGNILYERIAGDEELSMMREREIHDAMTVIIDSATMAEGTRENPWFVGDQPKWGVLAYTNELEGAFALYFDNAASSFDLEAPEYEAFRGTSSVIVETSNNYWIEPSVWRGSDGEEYETPADAYDAGATNAVPVLSDGSVKIPPKAEIQRCADGVHFAMWRNAEVGDPPFGPTNTLKAIMVSGLTQIRNDDVLLAIVPKAKGALGELEAVLDANLDASLESIGVGEDFRNRAFVGLSAKVGDVVTNEFASPITVVFPWNVHGGRFYTVVRSVAGTVETLPEVRSLSLSDIGGLQEFFYVDYANKQVWISAKSLGYYAFGEVNPEPWCLITVGNGEKYLGEDDPKSIATNFTIRTYGDRIEADDFAGYCVRAKGEAAGKYAINFTVVRKPEGLSQSAITILPGVFTILDDAEILKKWAEEDAAAGYPTNGYIHVRLVCDPTIGTVKGEKVYKLNQKTGTVKVSINATPKGSYVNSQGVRVNAGYVFAGWYLDPGFSIPATFDKGKDYRNASQTLTVSDNVYLFARFVEKSSTADPIVWLRYAGAGYCGADAGYLATNEVWYQGVALPTNACAVEFGSASLPTVTVKGLPAGVKFDKTTFRFTGAPTAASTDKKPVFTVTVSVKNKSGATDVITKNIRVEPLPAWAIGKFDGYHVDEGVTNGTFTATVGKTGKISGKTKGGLADTTFSAKNFSDVKSVGDELCYVAEVTVSYKDPTTKKTVKVTDTLYLMENQETRLGVIGGGDEDGCGAVGVQRAWDRKADATIGFNAFPAFSTKPAPTLGLDNGLTFKFGAKGKVTVSGTVNGVKVSGSTYVLPTAWHSTQTGNLLAQVYVYAPKAGVSEAYGVLLECGADGRFAEASPLVRSE